jgi:hypothetical protein
MSSTVLLRTLNTHQWSKAKEEFLQTRKPVLAHKSEDGFEFWVVEHLGHIAEKTVYRNQVSIALGDRLPVAKL